MADETREIEYAELALEVSVGPGGQREVRVLDSTSSGGGPRELFHPPFSVDELQGLLRRWDALLLSQDTNASRERERLAESIGEKLYRALLPGKVGEAFRRAFERVDEAKGGQEGGLRIRLSFGDGQLYTSDIVGLPWELLRLPDGSYPISSPKTPLVRHLDIGKAWDSIQLEPPIRVLAILASPRGSRAIDLRPHEEALRTACEREGMELEVMWRPPLDKLREQLKLYRARKRPMHILHFLGHGGYSEDGRGRLYFERSDGAQELVSGRALAQLLSDTGVQVAVLTTCVGARMMTSEEHHPFSGSASALVKELPAVVGMQFPVSETAAKAFVRAFYPDLAKGASLEEAVTEGRLAILGRDPSGFEWVSPVLFLRARSGAIHLLDEPEYESIEPDAEHPGNVGGPHVGPTTIIQGDGGMVVGQIHNPVGSTIGGYHRTAPKDQH